MNFRFWHVPTHLCMFMSMLGVPPFLLNVVNNPKLAPAVDLTHRWFSRLDYYCTSHPPVTELESTTSHPSPAPLPCGETLPLPTR